MASAQETASTDLELPRPTIWGGVRTIAGPGHASFTSRFGHAFPQPRYLESDLGTTAVYDLPPPSGQSKRQVLIVHGLNTPALGMLALSKALQTLDPDAHIVLFDLWGHGFSSTPIVAHTPDIVHFQIFQVLGSMQWTCAHLLGFSFGGATVVSFTLQNPWAVSSAALLGPGGILRKDDFSEQMQEALDSPQGRGDEAINRILSWLEGGPLIVPKDWREQAKSGTLDSAALREWELQEHRGHSRSVLSMFRDGGVLDKQDQFRAFAKLPVMNIAVLAELDEVCSESQLEDLGFGHVEIVKNHSHSFVRTAPDEVAHIIHRFWTQEAQ